MATTSFNKKVLIRSDKAADVLIKGLSKPVDNNPPKQINVEEEAERGKLILKRLYYR